MRRRNRFAARRLRVAVERLPTRTKEAMLRGIETNRIIVGAYVDPASGGICPMLAAHRNGGRTSVATFARAWDEYTDARRPRRATRREVAYLRRLLELSLEIETNFEHTVAELAAQVRAEREQMARCRPGTTAAEIVVPEPEDATIKVRRRQPKNDLLAATELELIRG